MSSEMIKCQHCGAFVPAEKAFCPNCSEPMEPEERPNRAHSFSPEMLSTMRDDPEKYKDMLMQFGKKKQPASAETPQPATPPLPPPTPQPVQPPPVTNPGPAYPSAPPATNFQGPDPGYHLQERKRSRGPLILGVGAVLLLALVIVLLIVFKVI